jgi:heat shock protein HtpX
VNRLAKTTAVARLISLMVAVAIPFALAGTIFGGVDGMLIGAAIGIGLWTAAYALSGQAIVRIFDAELVDETTHPELVAIVADLSDRAGIRTPRVAISRLGTPNAFAAPTPSGGVLGVTDPLFSILTRQELEAVIAHELIHLCGPGRSASTTAAMFAAIPGVLSMRLGCDSYYGVRFRRKRNPGATERRNQVFGFWFALPAALLVRLAGSRSVEFEADAGAVELCGAPEHLATALRKINSLAGRLVSPVNPALAHLLVVHPFSQTPLSRMFDAHPPMEERIARLSVEPGE